MLTSTRNKTLYLVQLALLTALVVVLQVFSNLFTYGNVAFSLSLVPVVVGALILGPYAGLFLGFVLGLVNFITSFASPFLLTLMNSSPVLYFLTCFGKTMVAGWISGLIFKALENKNKIVGVFTAAVACPCINTGIFLVMMTLFFRAPIADFFSISASVGNIIVFVMVGIITFNFFIELGLNLVLAPAFKIIVDVIKGNKGSANSDSTK